MVAWAPTFDNINFNGGNLSSDGGAILLLQYLEQIHLSEKISAVPFNDKRSLPVYSNTDILYQLIARDLLGYFNQADQSVLADDPLLSMYFNACSQPTVSRFFDRVVNHTNVVFKEIVTKMACRYVNKHVDAPIIDADSTLTETYGGQEASAYIHHYDEIGYHPLMINEFNSKLLLSARLRTGAAFSSNGIIGELQTILAHMYNRGNIRFRGDSAFYDTELLTYLESEEIRYYIRAKSTASLRRTVFEDIVSKDVEWLNYTPAKPYYGEIRYSISGSKTERRIVYKAYSVREDGQVMLLPTIYGMVTNDDVRTPKEAMDFYEERGASENFTKEFKNDFDGKHLSHSNFYENEMEFLISAISYNIFHLFQNTVLTGKDNLMTMNSFRMKFQKVAVKVAHHARKITLSFSSAYQHRRLFMKYWNLVLKM
jgi:hypothetical protein